MSAQLKRKFEEAEAADAELQRQKQARGREIGIVQAYDKGKGFGFVIDSDKEKIFVHQSQIISPGFRRLVEGQKISFLRGENRGKPWAEDVRNADGSPIMTEREEEPPTLAKKRRMQLKEQWRNFFDIPQYVLKGYAETLPATVSNQDAFALGETVPQLGKVYVLAHGCCASGSTGNECAKFVKEKMPKFIGKAYEDKPEPGASLSTAFENVEGEFMERAKNKTITDGAEVLAALFVHALNASGQPCVQLWVGGTGTCVPILCDAEGMPHRAMEPQTTKKERSRLLDAGFLVNEEGVAEVAFAEVNQHKPSQAFRLPASRLVGGRPFKTSKDKAKVVVHAQPEVHKAREWRCVAGEELFLVVCSSEVLSVLSDRDVLNVALDAWGNSASGIDGWEAAAKAVVRTAQAQGPASDALACMVVQFWWQEKPLQRLLARRADKKRSGVAAGPQKEAKAVDAGFDMFG